MRLALTAAALASLLVSFSPAMAAAPKPIVAVLGPAVGYLLGQSDLCGWGLTEKIEATYKASFKAIGLTPDQEATVWQHAKARRDDMAGMPVAAQTRMKGDTCTDAFRARFESDLAN